MLLPEIYGFRGAGTIAPFLEKKYGYHGIAAIVDEGGGYITVLGQTVAAFGTAEKGVRASRPTCLVRAIVADLLGADCRAATRASLSQRLAATLRCRTGSTHPLAS